MGQVYEGIHEKMALKARDEFGLKALVETGTYMGDTAIWAMDKFEKVYTIEISENLYKIADMRINNAKNVMTILGDSRFHLPLIAKGRYNAPTLFWLDAHWTGEMEEQDPHGCPLLDEIKAINENFFGIHVIMIDDYLTIKRLNWADSSEIMRLLVDKELHDRQVRIMDDVYFACHRIPGDFDSWKK